MPKFKGFSHDDGTLEKKAYFDGYGFGDKLLEGVAFCAEINDDGDLVVSFVDPYGPYERKLNQPELLKEALEYALTEDVFCDSPELIGGDLMLEPL